MNRLLVANRGEIALRVMKSAKLMGLSCIAVYSEADKSAPFVQFADEAYCIGKAKSSDSYLNQEKILSLCKEKNIDAIHPGYGFLSENYDFARRVEEAGIIFVGPKWGSMKIMGDKLLAKEAVRKYDIPLMPGSEGAIKSIEEAKKIASATKFPILIKASAGGGGKGMRIVESLEELEDQMNLAISEAKSAFGNGEVFIEKYIASPRHIEFQVLSDEHGNYIHLFDRECSIQRRHQKVVEEAPASVLDDDLRKRMGEAAVGVARACNYVGAGTVEFLLDADKNFYFMEMNTRLQVEHPVTELICGVDLVEQQLKVAMGHKLELKQENLSIEGHAIELRVYAEDPKNNFLPDIGTLEFYEEPSGEGIRVDSGYVEGMEIPIYYDPLISKLICYAQNREAAMNKMIYACENYKISGLCNTLEFGRYVMKHPSFRSGHYDTHFVNNHYSAEKLEESYREEEEMGVIFARYLYEKLNKKELMFKEAHLSNWRQKRSI